MRDIWSRFSFVTRAVDVNLARCQNVLSVTLNEPKLSSAANARLEKTNAVGISPACAIEVKTGIKQNSRDPENERHAFLVSCWLYAVATPFATAYCFGKKIS